MTNYENIDSILLMIEDLLDGAWSIPLSGGKGAVDVDKIRDLLSQLKMHIPVEVEKAKEIVNDRKIILDDAKKEAEEIIKTANDKLIALIDENEITKQAAEKANSIVERANADAKTTKNESYQYADRLLENVETVAHRAIYELEQCVKLVQENRDQLK